MKTLQNKLMVYDGHCKVCTGMKDLLVRTGMIKAGSCADFHTLESAQKQKIDADKFRNEMALLSVDKDEVQYGSEGVAYIFGAKARWIDALLRVHFLYRIFHHAYRTIAYNRYIIATPRNFLACDCFPDNVQTYRIAYIIISNLFAVMLTCLLGISLKDITGIGNTQAALQMLLIAGTGWILQMFSAAAFMKDKWLEYLGHLGSIMVVGLLIQVPFMLLHAAGISFLVIPLFSLLVSSTYMLYLHIYRIKYLQLSQGWSFSWFLFLQLGAASWTWFFYFKNPLV